MKAIKKPVPVEVWQITKYDLDLSDDYPEWVNELYAWGDIINRYDELGNLIYVDLFTLEGTMTGHQGDYLVNGNHDDVWIIQEGIFEDTYSIVEDNTETSNLIKYAESELAIAYKDTQDEYSIELQNDILEVVKLVSTQEHSGQSLATLVDDVTRLLLYKPITPIQEDEGWPDKPDEDGVLQNTRYSGLFKEKDGSYSDVENWGGDVTFPYYPK